MPRKKKFWEMPIDVPAWRDSPTRFRMTLEERGLYWEMLIYQWVEGKVPGTTRELLGIVAGTEEELERSLEGVMRQFKRVTKNNEGEFYNERLEEIRAAKGLISNVRAIAGRLGGEAKGKQKGSKTEANGTATGSKRGGNYKLRTKELRTTTPLVPLPGETWFADWWETYPRKIGSKDDAEKVFRKNIKTEADYELLKENTRLWVEREFSRREKDVTPYPRTFIGRGDWKNPPPVVEGRDDELKRRLMEL